MERRAAERFRIDLKGEASACARRGKARRSSAVKVSDVSSIGVAFLDREAWALGERVAMVIHVGDGLVGPYAYSLRALGWIVRSDAEGQDGRFLHGVAFDEGVRVLDWREIEARANGKDEKPPDAGSGGPAGA